VVAICDHKIQARLHQTLTQPATAQKKTNHWLCHHGFVRDRVLELCPRMLHYFSMVPGSMNGNDAVSMSQPLAF
jgi:hypothetical protein